MKGVILAGGLGTRLHPLTKVTNKCLLPVYDRPMIYYPIQSMVESGIEDIMLVCGGNAAGDFLTILGNGEQFGLKQLNYTYQYEPKGIADALSLAKKWSDNQAICVMLADNILQNPFKEHITEFESNPTGARIFLTQVENPEWYGVAEIDDDGNVLSIIEKPQEPKSNSIAIGLYIYDSTVWEYIDKLTPSQRGELEITDVNNHYLSDNKLKACNIDGYWADAGESIEMYMETNMKVWNEKNSS